jgi:hypothetical protein
MKKFILSLVLLALLAATSAQADWMLNSYRLAVLGGTRPTLTGFVAPDLADGPGPSRTISVNPPVGTSLIIAYIGYSHGNVVATPGTPTLAGVAMTAATPFVQYQNRMTTGFWYKINPTTGVAQNLTFSASVNWLNSYAYIWYFSGVDTSDPFGHTDETQCLSCQQLTRTFAPEYGRPYIVAGGMTRASSGGGACYTHVNLTELNEDSEDDEDTAYNAASNSVLVGAGSTAFSMSCNYSNFYRTMDIVEIKGP